GLRETAIMLGGLAERWQHRPVTEITEDEVFRIVDEARVKGVPGTTARNKEPSENRARKMHSALSTLFNWLKARRLVKSSPLANLKSPEAPEPRERVLSDEEIERFWKATEQTAEPFRSALKLMLLTGQRRDEVVEMRRSELSSDFSTWTLPAARTKN